MILGTVFTGLGYLVGAGVLWWSAAQRKMATQGFGWIAFSGLFAGIVGAKLTQLMSQGWPFSAPMAAVLDPGVGGRSLFGGMVAGWLGVEISKRRLGIRRSTGDLFALALPAGEAVGRIGCHFNQCCYGVKCDLPWAVFQHGAWRQPAQLYSSFVAAALFAVLFAIRNRVRREGELFLLYLAGFGVTRFGLEFVRWRESVYGGLSAMQWFCIELVVVSAVVWWARTRSSRWGLGVS
ncbi:MAG: prolipoprotein diacylglyceryl transferase [Fimbriimonas sp.]|nr:prolipoprotein diacylglyceryl transferase [Fimbriimonas sp.]